MIYHTHLASALRLLPFRKRRNPQEKAASQPLFIPLWSK